MKYFAYVLKDDCGKVYKGVTSNLKRRLLEHLKGKTKTTARMSNPKLVYFEKYDNLSAARKRELYFKSAAGRRFLKKQLNIR